MTRGSRLSLAALLVGMIAVAVAVVVVPARVRLGSKSFACESLFFPQPSDVIAEAFCAKAGAYRLRASLGVAALLAVLSLLPMLIERDGRSWRPWATWAVAYLLTTFSTLAILGTVGARHAHFLDL
jgi:hypothetical protein